MRLCVHRERQGKNRENGGRGRGREVNGSSAYEIWRKEGKC